MNPPITQCVVSDGVTKSCLPLEHLEVRATIIDTACEVTVVQRFRNHTTSGALRYVFSAPASSTVSGLKLRTEDGTVISTTPRNAADLPSGSKADIGKGSIDHNGGELISVSLENITGPQNLVFEIQYFANLIIEDPGRLRLHIPKLMVCPRASTRNSNGGSAPAPAERTRVVVDVYTTRVVVSITSSTHKIVDTSYRRNDASQQFHRRASFTSAELLATDFILFVSAEGFDSPRCIAQRNPAGAIGIQLSLIPRFEGLEASAPQEYLFVVDRSLSMTLHSRMVIAKRTLAMLLHMLPDGTTFNIFPFAHDCVQFRESSTIYDSSSQAAAIDYVERIQTSSGTNIYDALHTALNSRNACCNTVCFLITDGEDNHYGHQEIATAVAQKAAQADPEFPLRVFTVGIGNMSNAGRKTCSAVADAGHGLYSLAEESRDIMSDCTALFEAGRTFVLKNVSIDWNVSPRPVLQTPLEIPALQADAHVLVHALVEDGAGPVPESVVVHAQRDGIGEVLNFVVTVQQIKLAQTSARRDHRLQLMHTLAARGIVADRRRDSITRDDADTVTRLGMQYRLQTPFTPLVAVNTTTGQTVAVSSTAHTVPPATDGEQGPHSVSLPVNARTPLPATISHSTPRAPVASLSHPRRTSAVSAPSENEIYEFPLTLTDPVVVQDVRPSILSPRNAVEARSGPAVDISDEVEPVQETARRASTAIKSAVAGKTPAPPLNPAPLQPVGANDIISHLWRPDYWMCLVICGRQRHVNDKRKSNAPKMTTSEDTPQDVRNTPSNLGTATAVASQAPVSPLADATSPTVKASSPPPSEQTLLYLPSRPVAFFDTSARCPSTNKTTNWKLALFGTPKPRPFCEIRKQEIELQVQEFIARRRDAMKTASNGPEADYYADTSEDEEVDTEKVVEAQPEDDVDGSLAFTDGSAAQMDSIAERLILMQAPDGSFPPTLKLAETIGAPNCLEEANQANVEKSVWATALAVMFLRKCLRSQRVLRRRIVAKATEFLEASGMSQDAIEQLLHRARAALGPNVAAPANDLAIDIEPR